MKKYTGTKEAKVLIDMSTQVGESKSRQNNVDFQNERYRALQTFKENIAAKKIQRYWRTFYVPRKQLPANNEIPEEIIQNDNNRTELLRAITTVQESPHDYRATPKEQQQHDPEIAAKHQSKLTKKQTAVLQADKESLAKHEAIMHASICPHQGK